MSRAGSERYGDPRHDPVYEDVATKFGEHFVYIVNAMNHVGHSDVALWDETDGFYYDVVHLPDCSHFPMKLRSIVGLIPLFAVETIDADLLERFPGFQRRFQWFVDHRPNLLANCGCLQPGPTGQMLLSVVSPDRLRRILRVMLDEQEFLSPYGIRALSRAHLDHPYELTVDGARWVVGYEPAESRSGLFGGNSNWRGPVWFPVNYPVPRVLPRRRWEWIGGEPPDWVDRVGGQAAATERRASTMIQSDGLCRAHPPGDEETLWRRSNYLSSNYLFQSRKRCRS